MRLSVDLSTFRNICPIIWVVLECVYCVSVERERERKRSSHDLRRGNRTTSGSSSQHARNYAQPRLSLSRRPFLDRWFNYRLRSSFSCFPSLITSVSPFLSFSSSSSSFFFSLTSVLTQISRQVSFLLLPSQLACLYLSFSPLSAVSRLVTPASRNGIRHPDVKRRLPLKEIILVRLLEDKNGCGRCSLPPCAGALLALCCNDR